MTQTVHSPLRVVREADVLALPVTVGLETGLLLTGQQVCKRAGITYRQLDYWTRTGLLELGAPTPGSGHFRGYPVAQAGRAAVIKELLDAGLWLPQIRTVIDDVLERGEIRLSKHVVLHLADLDT